MKPQKFKCCLNNYRERKTTTKEKLNGDGVLMKRVKIDFFNPFEHYVSLSGFSNLRHKR